MRFMWLIWLVLAVITGAAPALAATDTDQTYRIFATEESSEEDSAEEEEPDCE